jgi:hypothetical protein
MIPKTEVANKEGQEEALSATWQRYSGDPGRHTWVAPESARPPDRRQASCRPAAGRWPRWVSTDKVKTAPRPPLSFTTSAAACSWAIPFVLWRLDRLGPSLRQLIGALNDLAERHVGFPGFADNIDTTGPGQRTDVPFGRASGRARGQPGAGTTPGLAACPSPRPERRRASILHSAPTERQLPRSRSPRSSRWSVWGAPPCAGAAGGGWPTSPGGRQEAWVELHGPSASATSGAGDGR